MRHRCWITFNVKLFIFILNIQKQYNFGKFIISVILCFCVFFTISNKKIPIVLVIHHAYQQDKTNSHIEKKDFNCRD